MKGLVNIKHMIIVFQLQVREIFMPLFKRRVVKLLDRSTPHVPAEMTLRVMDGLYALVTSFTNWNENLYYKSSYPC